MAAVKQLIIYSVLVSVSASSDVYKLVNSEVQLDTQDKNFQFDEFGWIFKKDIILKYYSEGKSTTKHDGYKDRVEFNTKTLSLTLKNLQKNDSGLYVAKAESNKEKVVAQYTLHVLDPVKEPELTSVYQNSSDSFNVTCLGLTLSINSSFDKKTCEESETLTEGVSYTLSLCVNGNQVICNHSNPASSKVTSKELNQLCPREPKSTVDSSTSQFEQYFWVIIIIVVIIVIIIIIISIWKCLHHHRWKLQQSRTAADLNHDNTVYQEVQPTDRTKPPEKPHETELPEGSNTLYATVEGPTRASRTPNHNNQTINGARPAEIPLERLKKPGPETLYVTVGQSIQTSRTPNHNNQATNPDNSNIYDETPTENYNEVELESAKPVPQTIYATVNRQGK